MTSVIPPPAEPVELKSDGGLWLRPLRGSHLDQLVRVFSDPSVARWNPLTVGPEGPRAAVLAYIGRRADWSTGLHASWGVFRDATDQEVLGSVTLHRIDTAQSRAEIGYWTTPGARSTGVATCAVRTAVDWGFEELGVFRLTLTHAAGNVASCRVAEKVGFLLEGTMRASFVYGDGQRHDEHLHGLLRTDPR